MGKFRIILMECYLKLFGRKRLACLLVEPEDSFSINYSLRGLVLVMVTNESIVVLDTSIK